MAPGFPWAGPYKSDNIRETCKGFATWLEENLSKYVMEQSTPDLWSQLQSLGLLLGGDESTQEEPDNFTEYQKIVIRLAIQQLASEIVDWFTPTSEQARIVHRRLEYLEKALDRLNRFDWHGVFLNTLITISITLSLDTERGRQLYELAHAAFSGLVRMLKW
jgi:hypothetical protein